MYDYVDVLFLSIKGATSNSKWTQQAGNSK